MDRPTVGSLFAGIGGLDLGFERAGFAVRWQVEKDAFARRVLAKHWPDAERHDDVHTFPPEGDADRLRVDCIIGGFPCQDISNAGKRIGIEGKKSGLWAEYARVVRVLRPRFIIVENVAALLHRGLGRVLGDLAACGYDAEWDCIPAAAVGAPHIRDRVFIVAYPASNGRSGSRAGDAGRNDPAPAGNGVRAEPPRGRAGTISGLSADAHGERCEEQHSPAVAATAGESDRVASGGRHDPGRLGREVFGDEPQAAGGAEGAAGLTPGTGPAIGGPWGVEPGMDRVAYGVPDRVDRLRCLGNAVVPQVAEWIARRVMAAGWPELVEG